MYVLNRLRGIQLFAEYPLFCKVVDDFVNVAGDELAVVIVDGEHVVDELVAGDAVGDVGDDIVGDFIEFQHSVEVFGVVAYCYAHVAFTDRVEIEFVFEFHIVICI